MNLNDARFARRVQGESRHVGIELQGWRPFAPMPQLAHALMPDPHWQAAARPLLDWILRLQS